MAHKVLNKNLNYINLINYNISKVNFFKRFANQHGCKIPKRCLSTLPELLHNSAEGESLYPPIKPKYPAGKWKNINEESAWKIHDLSHTVLQIPKAKERLEFLAGEESKTLWLVKALAPRPNNLNFQKIITKTHMVPKYEQLKLVNVNDITNVCTPLLNELYNVEYNVISHSNKLSDQEYTDFNDKQLHGFFSSAIKLIVSLLSKETHHLLRCEIDENVRVESFWRVTGFEGERKCCDGSWDLVKTINNVDAGVLQFQYKHNANLQIRTELPLCQFVSIDDALCMAKNLYAPTHAPNFVAINSINDRPINVSGHWIGSPCEFTTCSIHVMPSKFVDKFLEYGEEYLEEAENLMALTTMFGSCVAQAHNQGFCDVLDLTYPITTQCIVVNKHHVRFACYQLNTLQLWNDANPLQNLMWISDPINMLNESTHGVEVGQNVEMESSLNKYFVELLLKSILLKPEDRGVNLRPYLPDDESPVQTKYTINFKGEEPFEHPIIGRWQYPKHSIYF